MTFSNGLCIITKDISKQYFSELYKYASTIISKKLYLSVIGSGQINEWSIDQWKTCFSNCYSESSRICSKIDVRLLLPNWSSCLNKNTENLHAFLDRKLDVIISDSLTLSEEELFARINLVYHHHPSQTSVNSVQHNQLPIVYWSPSQTLNSLCCSAASSPSSWSSSHNVNIAQFENVAIGGTFDRMHIGHRYFLSLGALIASRRLTVGVSDGAIIHPEKTLRELIEPLNQRVSIARDFLEDVKPGLDYQMAPLRQDGFGPPLNDPNFQAIVATRDKSEVLENLNQIRTEKQFNQLELVYADFVESAQDDKSSNNSNEKAAKTSKADETDNDNEEQKLAPFHEAKVSSTQSRIDQLGKLMRPPFGRKSNLSRAPHQCYVIGVTGGIASGKSNITRYLKEFGAAEVIDCDKLGWEAYKKDSECYHRVVHAFGADRILSSETAEIDRTKLGKIVFSDAAQMNALTSIVWPEIRRLLIQRIEAVRLTTTTQASATPKVVVVEAAILLENGLDSVCHEVWVSFIPEYEAIQRIQVRNGLSADEAKKRVDSQWTNERRLELANVLFCSLWEKRFTKRQVKRAWTHLMQRLEPDAMKL